MLDGMTMSFFEIVIPAWVAYLKPSRLIVSSTAAIVAAPNSSTSSEMNSLDSFLAIVRLMNGTS